MVRTDQRVTGGLSWGVSARVAAGDTVSVLAVTGPGVASPISAEVVDATTRQGQNTSFTLDTGAAAGSLVLNSDGFVVGVIDSNDVAQVSDDIAPALSRIVLDNEQPDGECPPPPTTIPPAADGEEDEGIDPNSTEDVVADE